MLVLQIAVLSITAAALVRVLIVVIVLFAPKNAITTKEKATMTLMIAGQ